MTRAEFVAGISYLQFGCGRRIEPERIEVYFDALADLPPEVFRAATSLVLLEHIWSTFPSIAELRAAAVRTMRSQIGSDEAWALAWKAIGQIDPEIPSTIDAAFKKLPGMVADAIRRFGLNDLCYGTEPIAVLRAQFTKFFEGMTERDRRRSILPAKLRRQIDEIQSHWDHERSRLAVVESVAAEIGGPEAK